MEILCWTIQMKPKESSVRKLITLIFFISINYGQTPVLAGAVPGALGASIVMPGVPFAFLV